MCHIRPTQNGGTENTPTGLKSPRPEEGKIETAFRYCAVFPGNEQVVDPAVPASVPVHN